MISIYLLAVAGFLIAFSGAVGMVREIRSDERTTS